MANEIHDYTLVESTLLPGMRLDVYLSPLGINCGVLVKTKDDLSKEPIYKLDKDTAEHLPVHNGFSVADIYKGGILLRLYGKQPALYSNKEIKINEVITSLPLFDEKEFDGDQRELISRIDKFYVDARQTEYMLAMEDTQKINSVVQAISERDAAIRAKHSTIKSISANISRLREDTTLRIDDPDSDILENKHRLVTLNVELRDAMREYRELCSSVISSVSNIISGGQPPVEKVVSRRPRRADAGQ